MCMDVTLPDRRAVIADGHGDADASAAVLREAGRPGVEAVVSLSDRFGGPTRRGALPPGPPGVFPER